MRPRNGTVIVWLVSSSLLHWSCDDSPVPSDPSPILLTDGSGSVAAAGVPNAVFRTTPAESGGVISGSSPLEVEFNLCQSRPSDEDDDLKFTYDWNDDGAVDGFGHCRQSNTFSDAALVRVCVSDRRPGNEVCQTYDVRPIPTSEPPTIDFVMTLTDLGCSGSGTQSASFNNSFGINAVVQPPLPAGQGYSITATLHDPAAAGPLAFTAFQVRSGPDTINTSDHSPTPNIHTVSMTPSVPHADIEIFADLFTGIIIGPPRLGSTLTIDAFTVPGKTTRVVGPTTWFCAP